MNNYSDTGIGDFGLDLNSNLKQRGVHLRLMATPMSWTGFLHYLLTTLTFDGHILFNIGLTAWGRSGLRNFTGFLSIRLRHVLGRRDVILLHNVIEAVDIDLAGYRISRITQIGAHLAIRQLRGIPIVVFSQRVRDLLTHRYAFTHVLWHPLPVTNTAPLVREHSEKPTILMIGYLAPYKGYDLLLDALKVVDTPVNVIIAGNQHRILREDPQYQRFIERILTRAHAQGVVCIPRVPSEDLPTLMAEVDLGVLPYVASQGACAAASLLITHQIPILATNLPEFQDIARLGGGIVLSPRDAREFATRMMDIVENSELMEALRSKQSQYTKTYNWTNFVDLIQSRLPSS